jgi:zinc protease
VRNEFEAGENDPPQVLEERVASTAYLWHNYGKSTIGSREDIERVPIERLQAFYRKWYQPDNAMLVVAGRFEPAWALAKINTTFGAIAKPDRVIEATYTREPAQDGEREVTLRRVGDIQAVAAAYHIPSGAHPDYAALEVLGLVLGDEPSGRLYKALVETQKATSARSDAYQFADPGLLYSAVELRKEKSLEDAREALIATVEGFVSAPVSQGEVDRARDRLLKNWEMGMRNTQWAAVGLSEWAAMGDWRLRFLHRDRLRQVTAADVQRVATTYLVPANRTVGVYVPTDAPMRVSVAETPDVTSMVKDYKGGEALVQGEEFDATPKAIEGMTQRFELPGGMKVVLLPKKTRGAGVQISVNLRFGDEKSLRGMRTVGDVAASMLMRGTQKKSRQQISDEIDRLKARLFVGGGATQIWGGGETTRENLGGTIALLSEVLRTPSFPESEFALLQQEELSGYEEAKSDPRSMVSIALARHLRPRDPEDVRYEATPDEDIESLKKVTLDRVRAFHRDFYGASGGEIAVIGDFDAAEVHKALADAFGGWANAKPYARIEGVNPDQPAANLVLEAPDKESAVFNAGLRLALRDDDPDYPAMVLANFMTGGGFLNSRLATRIRQKDGLSYGIGSWLQASRWEKEGWFGAFAICAPQNAEKLKAAFREEIQLVVDKGFTAEEVAEAKSGWLQGRKVSRSQDRELAGTLADRAFQGRTLVWDEALEAKVAALTPEEIHAAVQRVIDPSRISLAVAGDFAKAAKQGDQSIRTP